MFVDIRFIQFCLNSQKKSFPESLRFKKAYLYIKKYFPNFAGFARLRVSLSLSNTNDELSKFKELNLEKN